jgi:hypothetical protein
MQTKTSAKLAIAEFDWSDEMIDDSFPFSTAQRQETLDLVDKLADVIDAEEKDDAIVIAALGTLLSFTIINAATEHNKALSVVKFFTENLVNSIDDAFQN